MSGFHKFLLLALAFLGVNQASAQSINWASDVAPILYTHCVQCHRDGGIGGFSLLGYNNAFSRRYSIQDATENNRMPPWKPDPSYRHFTGENVLSANEIQTIKNWLDGGAPAGNMAQAPADPIFPTGSEVGQPDQVLQTPLYTMGSMYDEYRCFVLPSGLLTDAYLRGIEVLPGNHEAVHHVLIYEDTTGQATLLDAQTPEPGYVSFGGIGVQGAQLVGAWVPGAQTHLLPPFMGIKLHAGSKLVLQVHFPASALGLTESSTVNLFYTPSNQGIREVGLSPLLNHGPISLEGYPLNIPANTVKTYKAKYTVPINASLISVAPHMHLIGRSITCFGETFWGDTIPLIRIPEWDFHWQGAYLLQKVEPIPIGTKLYAYATYDNTPNNPNNPSFPPQTVSAGEATTDEMMLVYFMYMYYQQGDENIVLDSTLLNSAVPELVASGPVSSLSVYPNPATAQFQVDFNLEESADMAIDLTDVEGRIVKVLQATADLPAGTHHLRADISGFPSGMYFVRLRTSSGAVLGRRILKQ